MNTLTFGTHTLDLAAVVATVLAVVVIAAVWFGIVQVTRPGNVRNAASHAAEHRGVAPLDENVDFTPAPPDTAI